jgi:hypothetical protein
MSPTPGYRRKKDSKLSWYGIEDTRF